MSAKPEHFRFLFIGVGLFLILIVCREFSVADNGDFSRYMFQYVSKPLSLEVNWPQAGTAEWDARFFNQPILYWSSGGGPEAFRWFTSAAWFWDAGAWLNRFFYHQDIIDLRYIGLPFFFLQAFAFTVLILSLRGESKLFIVLGMLALLVFSDARIISYYNSFFAESVPVLTLFMVFSFFAVRSYGGGEDISKGIRILHGGLTLALLWMAVLSKRQYIYFVAPFLWFFWYLLLSLDMEKKRRRPLLFFVGGGLFLVSLTVLTVLNRVDNESESYASRITSYHALYYGLLPHAKAPIELIEEIDLPSGSEKFIGKSSWNPESQLFIKNAESVNISTFLKAVLHDPQAYVKSALWNAREVGNFDIPLGMVFGKDLGKPPAWVSGISSASTRVAGLGLLATAAVLSCFMLVLSFGLSGKRLVAHRFLLLLLACVLVADVMISTFDGQQEARKHVLVASLACLLIYAQATMASVTYVVELARTRRGDGEQCSQDCWR
ncbi:glycan biosynthesis hexose transferase WsfD [Pseudomonas nitroreducens]|uniref:glycan biosynthesis hexose transferase WsfD n=1 Tax=Pseudomonas nitroreducens TaxID=46680 RepID=UPI003FA7E429